MTQDTLILQDDCFLDHDTGAGHPENAARLEAVVRDLTENPIAGTTVAAPRRATEQELASVHGGDHIARIAATAGRTRTQLDWDTVTSAESFEIALAAAGAALQGA